jgi:hypothetical protein
MIGVHGTKGFLPQPDQLILLFRRADDQLPDVAANETSLGSPAS